MDTSRIRYYVYSGNHRCINCFAHYQARFRIGSRNDVRQHGESDGSELCKRYYSGRQSCCFIRHGISVMYVFAGNYRTSNSHVLYLK